LQDLGIDVTKSFPAGAQVVVGGTANVNPRQPAAGGGGTPQLKNLHQNADKTVTIGQDANGQWIDQATNKPYQQPATQPAVAPSGGVK